MKQKITTILLAIALGFFILFITGCLLQINPDDQVTKYETFGRNLGTYFKYEDPTFVTKVKPYITGTLSLSDIDLIKADPLQTAYDYALENRPEDRNLIMLIKSGIDLYGIKVDLSKVAPEDVPKWTQGVRALLNGFLETSQ